ncbi:EAL domain-containing protein [Marinobacterium sp. D7]|uniref:sensor domain-containing protein n=1 Tax=Marinobacterium ramblicola TaxID=2849041 RepID=UPI001C2D11B3|nr:EAL domain-containing protein [Marinobacterium ramblicola]MBV1786730.1 EAL domain-containing protein [Marinobacterium ramblicola]
MSETMETASSDIRFHHIECLDRFSQANTNAFRASLLLSSLVVIGLWSHLPHTGLLTWLFATWMAQAAHEVYSRYYRRHRGHGVSEYRRWLHGFWLGAVVVGACWSLPFFLFEAVNHDVVLLLVFAIAGVTAYGGVARANVLSIALIFELAVLLPMCIWLFQQDSAIYRVMGVASLLFLAMLAPLLRNMNQMVTWTLRLDVENHRLSDEQKGYLERLRRREEEYRTLAVNLPVAVIRYDQEQRRRYINPAAERMLHGNAAEMLGQVPGEGGVPATPEMIERYRGRMAEVLATGEIREFEFVLDALPEGRHEHYYVRMAPEYGDDGTVSGSLTIWFDVTERKRFEEALQERGDLLHAVIESSPEIIVFALDASYRYLSFNDKHRQAMRAIWGKEITVGMSMLDVIGNHPDREEAKRGFDRALSGESFVDESAYGDEALSREYWQTFWSPIRASSGEVTGLTCFVLNVSERRRAEESLRRSEQLMRTVIDASPDWIFVKDRNHRYRLVNKSYADSLRIPPEDFIGKDGLELGFSEEQVKGDPAKGIRGFWADDQAVLESNKAQIYPDHPVTVDGEARTFYTIKVPLCDDDGAPWGVLAIGHDITQRKQAENLLQERYEYIVELNARLEENACTLEEQAVELEASKEQLMQTEAWYRGILQSAPDGMVVVDGQGVIRLVNGQLCRMFGYKDSELIGQAIELLVPFDLRHAHVARRAGFIESGSSGRPMAGGRGGLRACRKDGSEFFADVSLARLPDMDDAVGTICAAIRDVTERMRMEQALAKREQEFRTLVENSVDTVVRYGPDLRRLYVNPAIAALAEGGAAALLGHMPSECPGGAGAVMYENKLAEVFAEGKGSEFELKWPDRAGREMCSLISLTPEFDAQGEVASVLAVGRDITELNAFRQRIHQMAFYDSLTSLPNRALFNDRLRQMITDAAWHGQQAGLMMIDMDRFKAVNDTLGHPAGDELLRETAHRLSTCVRAYDTVARLGGDEFAILLPEIRFGDDLGRIAGKILEVFQRPFSLEGREVFVSCSIGIALYPGDSTQADDLLKYADSAMYLAKRSGRNNFRFYSRDLTESAHEHLVLESDLRRAIERDELVVYYQPKVSLDDGALIGSEALLRWNHPQRGLVPPDLFIGIAEDSGLIVEIGEWVFYEACRTACRWNSDGKPLHKVAINLSARQFQWGDLTGMVSRVLQETGCRADWIELEITESLLLDEEHEVLEVLNGCRSMGISIAIDDFGTGYSALSYLARFPIGTLKIDRSFISHVTIDAYRAELVKAILSIARCLGQQVVAEGVETEEQAAFLRAHGCRLAQGYLYGKPMPVEAFSALSQDISTPGVLVQDPH